VCEQLPATVLAEHRDMLRDLFSWLVQPCLDFVRHSCKPLIQTSPNHLVVMMLRLFHCLLDEIIHSGQPGYETLTSPQVCAAFHSTPRTNRLPITLLL